MSSFLIEIALSRAVVQLDYGIAEGTHVAPARGRSRNAERLPRPSLSATGCVRRSRSSHPRRDCPTNRASKVFSPPHTRPSGPTSVAAPQRPRLHARVAARGTRLVGRVPGQTSLSCASAPVRIAPAYRTDRRDDDSRRLKCGVPRPHGRSFRQHDSESDRFQHARRRNSRRQGPPHLQQRARRGGRRGPKTGVGYGRDTPIDGFGTIATPIGPIGVATSALSICGPLRQMPLDERNSPLTGLLRETAASLWRNAGVRTTESMRAQ